VSALDIFVLSTHREGFPLVILEAMALTKPVVATSVGGIPEIVKHRETGLLFNRENDEELAEHLLELLMNQKFREQIAAAGARLVERNFTVAEFGRKIAALYLSMIPDATASDDTP
jgi:glycosyltransferase involved in cell wall biosynthesis